MIKCSSLKSCVQSQEARFVDFWPFVEGDRFIAGTRKAETMAVTLNYVPHEGQLAIHQKRDVRFRTVCTGRRFGKTLCLAAELLDRGGCGAAGDYGWIAPTYNVAERGIDAFRQIATGFVRVVGRMPTRVEFEGAAGPVRVWFLSADNADNIRGYGFQGLVVDEAAMIPVDVWQYVLRPTISQTLGWAVFVSTPKGRNWFYDMHTRGLDPEEKDYASLTFPSSASPYFPKSEWDDARRTLPSDVFRQEYEAEFLEDSAGVFRGADACVIGGGLTAEDTENTEGGEGHREGAKDTKAGDLRRRQVVIGCDVAKHTDFTVLVAMDAETGVCFDMDRFNHLDWPIQKERILGFARRHRGRVLLDATGVGDPIYDDLMRVYSDVEPVKFTAAVKTALIQRLIVAVEQRQISWPGTAKRDCRPGKLTTENTKNTEIGTSAWDMLTAEMKRYEYAISATGHICYNAPSGYHDDCVIALALANQGRWEMGNAGTMARLVRCGTGGQRSVTTL